MPVSRSGRLEIPEKLTCPRPVHLLSIKCIKYVAIVRLNVDTKTAPSVEVRTRRFRAPSTRNLREGTTRSNTRDPVLRHRLRVHNPRLSRSFNSSSPRHGSRNVGVKDAQESSSSSCCVPSKAFQVYRHGNQCKME